MFSVMKIVVFLMGLLGAGLLDAKWVPMKEEGLVLHATDILVAEYQSMEEDGNVQRASFKVVEVWKGGAKEVVKVRGVKRLICAPVVNFTNWKKGRYLLILKKEEELYDPFNGGYSVVPITEGKVPWFVEGEGRVARNPIDLAQVKEKFTAILEKAQFDKGTAKAKEELAKKVIRYEIAGQPRFTDVKLKKLAKEKLGVEVVLLGCTGAPNREFHRGYQKTVKAFLLEKHGHDPVLKLEKELE